MRRSLTHIPHVNLKDIATIGESNILALLPSTANEIQIWDRRAKSLYFAFRTCYKIVKIKLHPDVILAICQNEVVVFHLYDTNQLCYIQTYDNPNGAFDFEDNYASQNIVVPSQTLGWVSCINWIDPDHPYSEFKAFDKPIKALRFSKNGKFVAVASDGCKKVRIFSVKTGNALVELKIRKKHRVREILFDKWVMQVIVVLEKGSIKLYNLPNLDENSKKPPEMILRSASFKLSKKRRFWTFFGEKLFEINVISEDCVFYRLKWDVTTKELIRDDGTKLETK